MVRVCVIGAGAAGICAARHAKKDGHQVTVYEQSDQLGGIWVYSPETNNHSAMYEVIKTNLPKEVMPFQDFPFPSEYPSFMGHEQVLKYLTDYADGIDIDYNHTVDSVIRDGTTWKVTVTHNSLQKSNVFDAVFVCNGHHFDPRYTVDTSKFTGAVVHSKEYRRAGDYKGQRVVVVGAGPSGIDIALQVAGVAENVIMIGSYLEYKTLPANVQHVMQRVSHFIGDSAVLDDGSVIERIDTVFMCTGYNMKFPFLADDIVQISQDGQMISPLYEHVLHVHYPTSLFFIGVNIIAATFALFEHQVLYSLSMMKNAHLVPSKQQLEDWEKERVRHLTSTGQSLQRYHLLALEQWDYYDRLVAGGQFPRWDLIDVLQRMYARTTEQKMKDIVGYKNMEFHQNGQEFTVSFPDNSIM